MNSCLYAEVPRVDNNNNNSNNNNNNREDDENEKKDGKSVNDASNSCLCAEVP